METILHEKELNFVKAKSIRVLLTLGTAILFFTVILEKLKRSRNRLLTRKRKRALESNMWAID